MNRYRSIPGLSGQQKANSTTVCQKCLKKGHYSYECKATTQDRPYSSRPSRTQQLFNPKLQPKLNSEIPNDLIQKKGVADEQLAKLDEQRARERSRRSPSPLAMPSQSRKRTRSVSPVSSDSISTISTNRSISPPRARKRDRDSFSDYQARPAKRRYSSSPFSRSRSRSISSEFDDERYGARRPSNNQRRRHEFTSPERRGRPESLRRGSRRTRSRSAGLDKSRIAKGRKSMTPAYDDDHQGRFDGTENQPHRREQIGDGRLGRNPEARSQKKERSLSPYSKRLALTQAMNLG